MRIIFFEVADWERDFLRKHFPQAVLTEEKLSSANVDQYKEVEIVSCFIYSAFTKSVIDKLPGLKFITTRSTGFDHIDINYSKKKGIIVSNVPEYGSNTVAEHTFGLILNLTRKIYRSVNQAKQLNFDHRTIRGVDIFGKTLGIAGLGRIGQKVLRIARGFEMNVLVFNRSQDKKLMKDYRFRYVDLDTLIRNSDIVTLHLPLNKATHHLINKKNILKFKKGSFLINTARGGLVDTEAIIVGLEKGILAGVGLDVLEEEDELKEEVDILTKFYRKTVDLKTIVLNHVLINHPRVLITPHNAFNSREALMRIVDTTIDNIRSYLSGNPKNLVWR